MDTQDRKYTQANSALRYALGYLEKADEQRQKLENIEKFDSNADIDIAKFAHDRYLLEAKEVLSRAVDACDIIEFFSKDR